MVQSGKKKVRISISAATATIILDLVFIIILETFGGTGSHPSEIIFNFLN